MVGASGAIAGVLGAYLVLYPAATVVTLVPAFLFLVPVEVPALVFLPLWFITQLVSGMAAITRLPSAGGVAFWAHAGGFLLGAAVGLALGPAGPAGRPGPALRPPAPWPARLPTALADLAAALLLLRFFLVMLNPQLSGFWRSLLGVLLGLTSPLVTPFAELAPSLRIGRVEVEVPSLLAAVAFHLFGGLLGWVLGAAAAGLERLRRRRS